MFIVPYDKKIVHIDKTKIGDIDYNTNYSFIMLLPKKDLQGNPLGYLEALSLN